MESNIEKIIKDTVGYNEAANKKSFMIGAQVAYDLVRREKDKKIEELNRNAIFYEKEYYALLDKVKSIALFFKEYSE